jgi:hypothetical protein
VSRRTVVIAAVAAAAVLAGCGSPASDLFEVERTGSIPGAELRIVVSDDGTVRCNGGQPKQIGDPRLLTARGLQRDLQDTARGNKRLAPGRRSVLAYTVRLPSGTLVYSDSSRGQTPAMQQLQGFVRDVSRHVCGFAR